MTTGKDFKYPDEFIDWVRETYPDQFQYLVSGDPSAWPQLAKAYEYWQAHPPTETYSQATLGAFRQWLPTRYSDGEIATIEGSSSYFKTVLQHYQRNIQGTQWDVGYIKPTRGRPQPEAFAITDADWGVLEDISPKAAEGQLRNWISTGKVTQEQAADVWDELSQRKQQERFDVMFPSQVKTPEERQAEKVEALRKAGTKGVAGLPEWWLEKYKDEPKLGEFIERREASRAARTKRQQSSLAFRQEAGRGFEAPFEREALTGTYAWKDWFERQFPSIVSGFRVEYPFTRKAYKGMTVREAQKEERKLWPEYLKGETAELQAEYGARLAEQRGEAEARKREQRREYMAGRTWAFKPRIQTVKF